MLGGLLSKVFYLHEDVGQFFHAGEPAEDEVLGILGEVFLVLLVGVGLSPGAIVGKSLADLL